MKTCSTCRQSKPVDAFNVMRRNSDGRQPRCRDCCKAWYAQHAAAHKANVRVRAVAWRKAVQRKIAQYLDEHHCVDCGEADIRVLDFDHRPGVKKHHDIARMITKGIGWERIQAEIAKCDVRCSNCHRRRTSERGGHWRQRVFEEGALVAEDRSSRRLAAMFGLEPAMLGVVT